MSPSFVGWSIPTFFLSATCSLQNTSRFSLERDCVPKLGLWKVRKWNASMAATYCWKVLNGFRNFNLTFVNSISFHCQRHNQNKADSTVNKNDDLFNLFVKIGFIIKERFIFLWCFSAWFHFQSHCELCRRTILCVTNWRSLSIVEKKIKIIQYIFRIKHRSELLKHFRRQVRYV